MDITQAIVKLFQVMISDNWENTTARKSNMSYLQKQKDLCYKVLLIRIVIMYSMWQNMIFSVEMVKPSELTPKQWLRLFRFKCNATAMVPANVFIVRDTQKSLENYQLAEQINYKWYVIHKKGTVRCTSCLVVNKLLYFSFFMVNNLTDLIGVIGVMCV